MNGDNHTVPDSIENLHTVPDRGSLELRQLAHLLPVVEETVGSGVEPLIPHLLLGLKAGMHLPNFVINIILGSEAARGPSVPLIEMLVSQ